MEVIKHWNSNAKTAVHPDPECTAHGRMTAFAARGIRIAMVISSLLLATACSRDYEPAQPQEYASEQDVPSYLARINALGEVARGMPTDQIIVEMLDTQSIYSGASEPATLREPGLAPPAIDEALGRLGMIAPDEYRRLLLISNGVRSGRPADEDATWRWRPVGQVERLGDGASQALAKARDENESIFPGQPWEFDVRKANGEQALDSVDPMRYANWWIIGGLGLDEFRLLAPEPGPDGRQEVVDFDLDQYLVTTYPELRAAFEEDWVRWTYRAEVDRGLGFQPGEYARELRKLETGDD